MLLLHKLGLATLAFGLVVALAAVAVAMVPQPPAEGPKPKPVAAQPAPKAVPAAQEPAWKTAFRKTYGLKDGELVRRVPPPHPKCRAEYFKDQIVQFYQRSKIDPPAEALNRDYTDYFTKFGWKDGWPVPELTNHTVPVKPEVGVRLVQLLTMTTGFNRTLIDADNELLETKVTGDWVVRAGADPAKLARALEAILRNECKLPVSVAVKDVEREVWVLSGKYAAKPLPDRKANEIEVYARDLSDRKTGGGGTGTLSEMTAQVEGFVEAPVVLGPIEGAPKRVSWHYNFRSPFTQEQRAEDHDPTGVLNNIAAQTGLAVKQVRQKVAVLVVKRD